MDEIDKGIDELLNRPAASQPRQEITPGCWMKTYAGDHMPLVESYAEVRERLDTATDGWVTVTALEVVAAEQLPPLTWAAALGAATSAPRLTRRPAQWTMRVEIVYSLMEHVTK